MSSTVPANPRVSVVVPTYKAGPFLLELCASLVAQTMPDFEVLVLSDGCDDHQQPGVERYAADPRFRFLSWTPNQGVARATEQLLREVRAPFWCNPGADDLLHPEFLAHRLAAAEKTPAADIFFGAGIQIDAHGREIWYHPARVLAERLASWDGQTIEPAAMLRVLLQENVINTPSIFCRSATTIAPLLAAEVRWKYAQDYHYWLLLAGLGRHFHYDARVLHSYRMSDGQLSRDPAREATRLAEFRLVPLVALRQAADQSPLAASAWREWKRPLHDFWLWRKLLLARRGQLSRAWSEQASVAYHGRTLSRAAQLLEFCVRAPAMAALRWGEKRRARRQIWTNGLRLVDEPIFRA